MHLMSQCPAAPRRLARTKAGAVIARCNGLAFLRPDSSALNRRQALGIGTTHSTQRLVSLAAGKEGSAETYDVFVNEPVQLEEGVRKHVLSVFVGDEAGMINRVAGVFARRGANIESLAVGLCEDKALFTIVATGTDQTIAKLSNQIAKLVNVRYVEDITDIEHIERELVLVKVKTPPGEGIAELRNLAEIFRARILDVGTTSCTLMLTGDTGKAAAFRHNVAKFGMLDFSRTGRIAINRGEYLFDPMSRYETEGDGADAGGIGRSIKVKAGQHEMGVYSMSSLNSMDSDEILLGSGGGKDVLGATYAEGSSGGRGSAAKRAEKILSLNVEDVPGVLNEVTGVIARRGFNIRSLAVGNSEAPGMSRITIAVPVGESNIQNLIKQLYKLIHVATIDEIENKPHVERELMMIKVACNTVQRGEVFDISRIFRGSVCDISRSTVTIEIAGKEKKLRALQEILEPYGILEVARTGLLVSLRDSGVDSSYLDTLSGVGRV